jgi:hypothetical protein
MTDATMTYGLAAALAAAAMMSPPMQSYRLAEVGGKPLPAEVKKELNCREFVTGGELTLGADSLWSLRVALREECGKRSEVETETENGRYSMTGDSLRFFDDDDDDDDRDDGDDLDLDDLKSGTLSKDGTLTVRLEDDETTLVFRK